MSEQSWNDLGIDIPGSRRAGNVKVRCPRCSGTSKHRNKTDLSVDLDQGLYRCHNNGCDFAGSINSKYREGPRPTHIRRDPDYDRKVFERPDLSTYREKVVALPEIALDWLKKRGISKQTAEHFQLGWIEYAAKDEESGLWEGALVFPFFRDGELINFKRRTLSKRFGISRGAELIYFNLDAIEATTIIVEGEMDVLALYEAGFTNVISVPNGAPDPEKARDVRLDYFDACANELGSVVQHFVMAGDSDGPGQFLIDEHIYRIGKEFCSRVAWPEGCKDANDVLLKYGPEALRAAISDAKPYPVSGIARPKTDLRMALDTWRRNGLPSGLSTGWSNLDEYWRPVEGEMTIITGVPSHGKSSWCDALLIQLYQQHGWKSVIFSPENYPTESHAAKLLELLTGKSFDEKSAAKWRMRGERNVEVITDEEYEANLDILEQATSYIVTMSPDGDGLTLDQILELARTEIYRRGTKILVIDPWNEVEHQMEKHGSETMYISSALSKIRRFARHTNVHIFIIAHPTKLQSQVEKFTDDNGIEQSRHTYPVPDLYHISGSAAWKNKADNGISVWRDEHAEAHGGDPNLNRLVITKVKRKWVGRKGEINLIWSPVSGRFSVPPDQAVAHVEMAAEVDGEIPF